MFMHHGVESFDKLIKLTATLDLYMLDSTQSDTTGSIRPILIIFPKIDTLKKDPIFVELD